MFYEYVECVFYLKVMSGFPDFLLYLALPADPHDEDDCHAEDEGDGHSEPGDHDHRLQTRGEILLTIDPHDRFCFYPIKNVTTARPINRGKDKMSSGRGGQPVFWKQTVKTLKHS